MRGRNHFLIMPDKTGVDLIINELAVKDGKLVLNMSDGEKFIVDRDELHAAIDGMSKPLTVATKNDMLSLDKTSLTLHQRIFVKDDGDGKWAYYMVTGLDGDAPEFTKISDEDIWGSLFSDGVIAQVSKIGDLSDLNADLNDPVTLVEAINNVLSKHLDLANKVGDVSKLTTTEKGTIVGAINELKVNITTNADGILEIKNEIGDVTKINLDDADKETIVDALNKIIAVQGTKLDSESVLPIIISYTGVLSDLNTTAKDNLVAAINEVLGKLNDEVARATKVEGDLTQLITGDKTDLVSAINSVKNDLTTEVNRATQAENNLQTAIDNEVSRAQKAEADLQTAIDNEVARAKSVEGDLTKLKTTDKTDLVTSINEIVDGLTAETTRATQAESDLQTAIDNEVARAQKAESDIQAELDNTQKGAGLADDGKYVANTEANYINTATSLADADNKLDAQVKVNADAIKAEIDRAQKAEADLQTAINNEVDRAKSAEADLQTAIDNEVSRAQKAESDIQAELDNTQKGAGLADDGSYVINDKANYIANATSLADADNKLDAQVKVNADAIKAEINRAQKAEADLQTAIDNEVARAQNVESNLDAKINSEVTRAKSAEGNLEFDEKLNTTTTDEDGNQVVVKPTDLTDAINKEVARASKAEKLIKLFPIQTLI